MASQFTGVQIATAVGLFATGLTSGMVIANPLRIDPLYTRTLIAASPTTPPVSLSASVRLAIWHEQYLLAAKSIPPLGASATLSLFAAGMLAGPASHPSWILRPAERGWYWLAAVLAFSIVPITVVAIRPVNDALFEMRRSVSIDDSAAEKDLMEQRFAKWCQLHYVRVVVTLLSFGMTIAAALVG